MRRSLLVLATLAVPLAASDSDHRWRVPDNLPIEDASLKTEAEFTEAASGASFGLKLELEISRDGSAFRPVPLNTPVCNHDHVAFRLTPSEPGYATIFNQYPKDGQVHTKVIHPPLCPSSCLPCSSSQKMSPEQPMRFPPSPSEGFPIFGEAGEEGVLVMVSPSPFSRQALELAEDMVGCEPSADVAHHPRADGQQVRAIDRLMLLRDPGRSQDAFIVTDGEELLGFTLNHTTACPELPR